MTLHQFLEGNKAGKDNKTHTSLNPPRKYHISSDNKQKFFNLYSQTYLDVSLSNQLSIVELQTTNYIPIIVDVDLKKECSKDTKNHPKLYAEEHIRNICEAFMNVLSNVLDPSPEIQDLSFYVLERPGYFLEKNNKCYFKNGFHLHCPTIMLTRQDIRTIVIPKVLKYMRENEMSIPETIKNYKELIDECIYEKAGKPWFLYGSSKECASQPYLISKCYEIENNGKIVCNKTQWLSSLTDYQLVYMSHDGTSTELQRCLPEIFSLQTENRERYYYNIDGSVEIEEEERPNMLQLNETVSEFAGDSVMGGKELFSSDDEEKNEAFCKALLDLLPEEYTEDYTSWFHIGLILYNIFDGNEKGFELWDEFSKRCEEKYDYNYSVSLWNKMEKKTLTLGSLRYIVKMKRPSEYKELVNTMSKQYMKNIRMDISLTGLHYDLAKMLFIEYEGLVKCSSIKHNRWYVYKEHHWSLDDEGIFLTSKISTLLVSKYNRRLNELQNEEKSVKLNEIKEHEQHMAFYKSQLQTYESYLSICPSNERAQKEREIETFRKKISEKENAIQIIRESFNNNSVDKKKGKNDLDKQIEIIQKIIANLKTHPFKRNIINEAREIFYDKTFEERIDKDKWLFCFNNGVYDLKAHLFRPGVPDDMLSLKSKVNYDTNLTIESEEIAKVKHFFLQLFPNRNIREYLLFMMSEIFEGRNSHKCFFIFTGSGNNGKTIFCDMFEKMLGDLAIKLPTSIICGKRTSSSSATPELERAGSGRRLAMVQEAGVTDRLNSGIIKELSGNDTYYSRGLFKDGREITPMFTPLLICNEIPRLEGSENDDAIWRRLVVIDFQSKFLDDHNLVPETWEEQFEKKIFPCDIHFSDKVPSLTQGLAWYLLHLYKNREVDTMVPPKEVLVSSEHFRNENDHINQFLTDMIVCEKGKSIKLLELFDQAKDHIRNCNPYQKPPSLSHFKKYIFKKYGQPDNEQNIRDIAFKNTIQ